MYKLLCENREKEFIKFKLNLVKDSIKLSHCYISAKGISIVPNVRLYTKLKVLTMQSGEFI